MEHRCPILDPQANFGPQERRRTPVLSTEILFTYAAECDARHKSALCTEVIGIQLQQALRILRTPHGEFSV